MARIRCLCPYFCSIKLWWAQTSLRCLIFTTAAVLFCVALSMAVMETIHSWRNKENDLTHWNPKYRRKPATIDEPTDVKDPSLHYGIVIDCGSSGSRVYIYFWPTHSGNPKDLLDIQPMRDEDGKLINKKIQPGLSEYADRPSEASIYMKPLLDYASQFVPESKHKETPLYILATAGMRLLSLSEQNGILEELRQDIPREYSFLVAENHFEVITGKQEGVYSWVAINFVLNKFVHGEEEHPLVAVHVPGVGSNGRPSPHIRRRTVGMIDMGGASVQIAFEVPNTEKEISKNLLAEFNLGCRQSDLDHTYRVYVTTFLGYGANEARERYEMMLIKPHLSKSHNSTSIGRSKELPLLDPCLPVNMIQQSDDPVDDVTLYFKGTGDFLACRAAVMPLLNLTVPCQKFMCSMNGVFQPDINFHNSEFFGFSEFWYTTEDVFRMAGPYNSDKFVGAAKNYCNTEWSTLMDWYERKLYPKADQQRFRLQCFKSAWIHAVLHDGFKFPTTYTNFRSAQLVNGKDVQWTLGALIYRTRFIPLREIEKHEASVEAVPVKRSSVFYPNT
ncbi:ectonucleoside triphosphate diphosphohydrolase 4-like isoform X2 [Liolophura sinensis]|uniref:ectonucleoside triphosphate diphosphohydrolase 4-like isoform X2 n=1 Tax=Liolophura sinensis TaxID=3198878 RepID=UPI003159688C